jgi:uncharacterized protein YeeX (DUF496 family)
MELKPGWNDKKTIYIKIPEVFDDEKIKSQYLSRDKVIIFEFDETIVQSNYSKKPIDGLDIKIRDNAKRILRNYNSRGYCILFISNQDRVMKGFFTIRDMKNRADFVIAKLKIPVICFFSIARDGFHKPHTWAFKAFKGYIRDYFSSKFKDLVVVSHKYKQSNYTDAAFAHNINAIFKSDREFFEEKSTNINYIPLLNEETKQRYLLSAEIIQSQGVLSKYKNDIIEFFKEEKIDQSITIIMGPPNVGKTQLAKKIHGKISSRIINISKKNIAKAVRGDCNDDIAHRLSIILDVDIPDFNIAEFLQLANKYRIPVIYIKIDIPQILCEHIYHVNLEKDLTLPIKQKMDHKSFNKKFIPIDVQKISSLYSRIPFVKMIQYPLILPSGDEFNGIYF